MSGADEVNLPDQSCAELSLHRFAIKWTPERIGQIILKAFVTLDRMPPPRGPRVPGGHWPRHRVEWADQLSQAELDPAERRERETLRNRILLRPTGQEIAQMEKVLDWMRKLHDADPAMALVTSLWAIRAARGRSIKGLCEEKNWTVYRFNRQRSKALNYLADWLNRENVSAF